MKLNQKQMAFGRHETFPLRFSWLPKGYQAFSVDNRVFESDGATVALGVGKNMVSAIRFWLRATQLLDDETKNLTELAHFLLCPDKGVDPYLEDEGTLWLLHWLMCSNPSQATSWFWFFNNFHKTVFTSAELQTALKEFVDNLPDKRSAPSLATLKNDCAVLTRMYSQSDLSKAALLDETLDSPMSLLSLISRQSSKQFSAEPSVRNELPTNIFGFAVAQAVNLWVENENRGTVLLDNLLYSRSNHAAPGAVFRLTESGFMKKLEELQQAYPNLFSIRESAGISQLYLAQDVKDLNPLVFLNTYYSGVYA